MPDALTLPTAHELIRRIEAEARPGGAWTYDADPAWSPEGTIVFPERLLLRITRDDEHPGYTWRIEQWNPADETYQPVPGQSGAAESPTAMAEVAVAFIDEHNAGEPLPVTVYPLADELGERIQAGYPRAHWTHYVNDVYAAVFEYPAKRRLAFWDEADFMGSIDGYTWAIEEYRPAEERWVPVAASSDMVSIGQLRRTIADFHNLGETPYRTPDGPADAPAAARDLAIRAGRAEVREQLAQQLAAREAALGVDQAAPTASPAPGRSTPSR